eukprot:Pompholyxophrys_punicea_v1_NODE_112_length_3406_cov_30.176067.p4 type:complete len:118 gc:universal NODE_112_length_3406_cov_30.176067:1589-1236(-)
MDRLLWSGEEALIDFSLIDFSMLIGWTRFLLFFYLFTFTFKLAAFIYYRRYIGNFYYCFLVLLIWCHHRQNEPLRLSLEVVVPQNLFSFNKFVFYGNTHSLSETWFSSSRSSHRLPH